MRRRRRRRRKLTWNELVQHRQDIFVCCQAKMDGLIGGQRLPASAYLFAWSNRWPLDFILRARAGNFK